MDIVAEGYDAGIQHGEVIERDMIAVPLTGDIRLVVVGAPAYFARRRAPRHPRDLAEHECISWHATPEARPYRWEFTEGGREFSVAVRARVLTTDPALMVRLVRAGMGLTMVYEVQVRDDLARGDLVAVLEEFLRRSRASTYTIRSDGTLRLGFVRSSTTYAATGCPRGRARRRRQPRVRLLHDPRAECLPLECRPS